MSRIVPEFTDEQRIQLVSEARALLGREFRHQGRRESAMDCIGLVAICVSKVLGYEVKARTDYGRLPAQRKLEEGLTDHFGPSLGLIPSPGDVVSMEWYLEPNHVGIVSPHPEYGVGIIHCYLNSKRVIEHGMDRLWRSRITGVYRP